MSSASGGGSVSSPGLDSLVACVPVPINGDLCGHSVLSRIDWCFNWDSERVRAFVFSSVVTDAPR